VEEGSRRGAGGEPEIPREIRACELPGLLRRIGRGGSRKPRRGAPGRPTKYGAQRVNLRGWMWFRSKREARYFLEVVEPGLASGELLLALPEVPIRLPGGTVYRLDWLIVPRGGGVRLVEVKGFRTDVYKAKKRDVEALYGLQIEEV